MKDRVLYILWAVLYGACGLLGFIDQPQGLGKALLVLLSWCFFIPPAVLLYRAIKRRSARQLRLLRGLSLGWLGLTLVLLLGNFLSVLGNEVTGSLVYGMLVMLASPMVCGQFWVVSLFLWAVLLLTSHSWLKKLK